MFRFDNYYKSLNNEIMREFRRNESRLKYILEDKKSRKKLKRDMNDYFVRLGKLLSLIIKMERNITDDYFSYHTYVEIKRNHDELYEDIKGKNYEKSYCNPDYAIKRLGKIKGQILTYFAAKVRNSIQAVYQHKILLIHDVLKTYLELFDYVSMSKFLDTEEMKKIVTKDLYKNLNRDTELYVREKFTNEVQGYTDLIRNVNFDDLRYLYRFGRYIGDNEIKVADYIAKLPEEEIEKIAKTFTEGYRKGFLRENKDISLKSTVAIRYPLGFERIIKKVLEYFKEIGFDSIITDFFGTSPNKQFGYDHRFDHALFFSESYAKEKEIAMDEKMDLLKDVINKYGGPAVLETFGEEPFKPMSKESCIKLSEEQSKAYAAHRGRIKEIIEKYMASENISFTIMALPIPEIGQEFENIFKETCKVNTLDSDLFEKIQQKIVDVLDKGEFVHIKGKEGNKTDIKVNLNNLNNPEKETNFFNCVADVNIPVGEVFTSPKLTGTNGILHVEEVFLRELKYENLSLVFEDGFVKEYSCSNFKTEEENKKYIEENLLFPHKTLPMGEFAIGTNTTAYVMANKYNIINKLPILIVEKMGPHFAVGDTCYSWVEDIPIYNLLDNKEIVARDNEKSILRKTNIEEAYTQVHTDITLPYEVIEEIAVVKDNEERIPIIQDGKFVLEGTEKLNEPLEK